MAALEQRIAMKSPGATHHVLVADDDAELLALIAFALRNADFDVVTVTDGQLALDALAASHFDLAVLDINMPQRDGFAVCEHLRGSSSIPVIMLSARSDEADIVHALSIGADDYITKPFSPRTLIARIRALLRRSADANITELAVGAATLDIERHALRIGATQVPLTPLETNVLRQLFRTPGRLVTTERLASEAWGRAGSEERHALKQVVYRLRRKLEHLTTIPDLVETTRGAGYRWSARSSNDKRAL